MLKYNKFIIYNPCLNRYLNLFHDLYDKNWIKEPFIIHKTWFVDFIHGNFECASPKLALYDSVLDSYLIPMEKNKPNYIKQTPITQDLLDFYSLKQ